VKIALVEDHLMMREMLRKACTQDFGHEVVAEAASGPEAITVVLATLPDLLILDLQLPGVDGLAVLRAIRAGSASCRVLVLSSHCSDYTLFLVEKARVDGFVDKNSSTVAEVRKAVAAIGAGSCYFSAHYLDTKAARRRDPHAFDKVLSDREQTVLILIGRLLTDGEAATELGISVATVAKHRFNILKKLGLPSTAALARYARDRGFSEAAIPGAH
jgi:DNA-binding NarL/FixJ family response regulator